MKISNQTFQEPVAKLKKVQPKVKKDDTSGVQKQDKVSISSESNKTAELKGYSPEDFKTENKGESRADKIARIKEAVQSNTYNVSSEKVADKIVGAHINEII